MQVLQEQKPATEKPLFLESPNLDTDDEYVIPVTRELDI